MLDDFSEFIEKNYKEHCELERKEYERGQSGKPLSFIGKRIENFDIFSQELINQRRS